MFLKCVILIHTEGLVVTGVAITVPVSKKMILNFFDRTFSDFFLKVMKGIGLSFWMSSTIMSASFKDPYTID